MTKIVSFFLCLSISALGSVDRDRVKDILSEVQNAQTPAERLGGITERLNGIEYGADSLGEGSSAGFDRDSRYWTATLNCTIHTEIATALYFSRDVEDYQKNLDRLRYEGKPSFFSRKHFPSLDWIPGNTREGNKYFVDVTKSIGKESADLAKTNINKHAWYGMLKAERISGFPKEEVESKLKELQTKGRELFPEGETPVTTQYIPFNNLLGFSKEAVEELRTRIAAIKAMDADDEIKANFRRLIYLTALTNNRHRINTGLLFRMNDLAKKEGVVINYVCPDRPLKKYIGTNMNVTHQGFMVWKDDTLFARHASSDLKKVADIDFLEYIVPFLIGNPFMPKGFNLLTVARTGD